VALESDRFVSSQRPPSMCGEIYKDRALRAGRTPFRSIMTTRQTLSVAGQLQFSVLLCAVHREPREYLGDGLGAIIRHGI
jgi:hypothetical protein